MANIKSAKKRISTIAKKTAMNKSRMSDMKTAMKKVYAAVNANDKEAAQLALRNATKKIDMVASKGTIHKNKASRLVSRLTKSVNAL